MDSSFFGLPANLTSYSFYKRKHKTCCILVCVVLILTFFKKEVFFSPDKPFYPGARYQGNDDNATSKRQPF